MMLLCYLFPPLAVLLMGRPISAVFNAFLTFGCFWMPGVRHALACYVEYSADKKFNRVVDAVNDPAHARRKSNGGVTNVTNNYYGSGGGEPVNHPGVGINGTVFRKRS